MFIESVGKRVKISRFTKEDICDKYLSWLNDESITKYSNQRFNLHNYSTSLEYLASFKDTKNLFLAIKTIESDELIGTMTAYISPNHQTADLGILLGDKSYTGKGYALESWNLLISWCESCRNIRKITAGTIEANKPMIKLMDNSGMTFEGSRKHQEIFEGKPYDILYYGKFFNQ